MKLYHRYSIIVLFDFKKGVDVYKRQVVVRHNRKKKRAAQKNADEPRGREREFELEKEDEPSAEAPRPKQTGGANKMGDRSRM